MTRFDFPLPIDDALPALTSALEGGPNAVLVAPPGAGKTTRVPLALLDAPWRNGGKIILLEPRRIAARAAADRMSATLGESTGGTVGLRVRLGSKISGRTVIEVVTEGVFARMILEDPELSGVAAVLFDEFHERSLDADLGLALALDAQAGLRPDLRVLVMSATIDGARVAGLLGAAPVVTSEGRAFPVETRHVGRDPAARIEDQVTEVVLKALREEHGSVLVFLPGQGEIRRVETRLSERLRDASVDVVPLYGALDARTQDAAIRPAPAGKRKVVLATSIAETSLTIEGVRVVVDSGLARVPVYEPAYGLSRLETVRVSRAAADQRRGRAGRVEPGVCYRLWEEAATASLPAFATPEILAADLSGLVLDLAAWGVRDPATLAWLDPPPTPAVTEARTMLQELGALDGDGRVTALGRDMRRLPLPPRLAAMVLDAARRGEAQRAAEIAVVMVERGLGGDAVDVAHRLDGFRRDRSRRAEDARGLARRWAEEARTIAGAVSPPAEPLGAGLLLAHAFPDRIAERRGQPGAFRLANGRGAQLDPADALAREAYLAIGEMTGTAAAARILAAAALTREEIEQGFADRIEAAEDVVFDAQAMALRARAVRRLGAVVLSEKPLPVPAGPQAAAALARGIARLGIARLPWTKAQMQRRARVNFLRRTDEAWPDLSDEALAKDGAPWLAAAIEGRNSLAAITAEDLSHALDGLIPWDLSRRVEAEAPTHFEAPTGSRVPIDYDGAEPSIAIRVQELFGLAAHPSIAGGRLPLVVELLSPAHRPVQVTRDLPGFWRGSYAAVRSEMRGRYPKHPWPEDPLSAPPTTRAKPRGT